MPKYVMLHYSVDDGTEFMEKCHLLSDDMPVRMLDGNPVDLVILARLDDGHHIFEDEDGVFTLPPNKVLGMQDLDD